MNKTILLGIVATLVSTISIAGGYFAGRAGRSEVVIGAGPGSVVTAPFKQETAEIEAIVRNYLLKNPEIINEVQTALETKKETESKSTQTAFLSKAGPELFNSKNDAIIGNPQGDVTVVEFFDYNCGYCRKALSDMDALVKSDPKVRFVLKELPILGPDSVKAHIVSQAFRKLMPEKYAEFHRTLLQSGHADEASAIAIAASMGVDEAKLKASMQLAEIGVLFDQNNQMAQGLNITGTPSYVIKDTVIPGALGFEVLSQSVANVRKCQSTTC
jgi:protein-disulfide isomerase